MVAEAGWRGDDTPKVTGISAHFDYIRVRDLHIALPEPSSSSCASDLSVAARMFLFLAGRSLGSGSGNLGGQLFNTIFEHLPKLQRAEKTVVSMT